LISTCIYGLPIVDSVVSACPPPFSFLSEMLLRFICDLVKGLQNYKHSKSAGYCWVFLKLDSPIPPPPPRDTYACNTMQAYKSAIGVLLLPISVTVYYT